MPTCSSINLSLPSSRVLGSLDASAKQYIQALATVGVTATSAQKKAINSFVLSEKAASRWSLHKRIHLPIWASASANAIDMVSLASGTFAGTVTHASGYVQGNGSTGRFDWGTSPNAQALTTGSACIWRLVKQAHSTTAYNVPMGCTALTGRTVLRFERSAGNDTFGFGANITSATAGTGIFIGSETASNSRFFRRRTSSGATSLGTNTSAQSGAFPATNMSSLCVNANGLFVSYSDEQAGAWGMSLGLTTTQADAFTLNLETLWETCTGLTLP